MSADFSASLRIPRSRTRHLLTLGGLAVLGLAIASCHSETGPSATQLAFTVQPATMVAGTPFSVTVEAQDAGGNLVSSFTGNITISVGTGPTGGALSGTTTMAAVNGVATFTGLTVTVSGGYSLQAAASGLTGATSNGFSVNPGTPAALAFTTQPGNAVAGASITIQVTARDQYSNVATGFTGAVQIALGSNPGGGTLSGTTSANAVAGVVNFSTLSINKVGAGYTLTATPAAGAPPAAATSNAFNINPGTPSKLAFTVQPPNGAAGSALSPAIQVTAQDAQGNTTPAFTGNVTLALVANPGSATLAGNGPVAAVAGVATFAGVTLNKPGTGYTIMASATGLTAVTSNAFNISVGALAQLIFKTQPSNAAAGAVIAPSVQIEGQDAAGNTVTTFTGNVTVAFGNNVGNGTLGGTLTRAAVAGVATFNDLTIDKIGTGYTLNATSGGVPQITSATFNITAAVASQLKFSVQPVNTTAGSAITPAVVVQALDQFGNLASGFSSNVTVAIGANANSGTLSGTKTIGAANGVATFSTLSIDSAGTGYTLTANAAGLPAATSSTFDIVPGSATHLRFGQQPTSATAGAAIAPAVTVQALDAQGNVATGFTGTVTVAIGNNAGSGTLSGTASNAAVAGVATFSNLSINKSGTGYTLTAGSGSLTGATSTAFNIIAGTATQLAFSVQPANTAAGAAFTPAVKVAAQDGLGNVDLTYTANVTLAIGNNAGPGGTLTGGGPIAAVAGVATFSAASIDKVGTGYTLTAASGALTGATSNTFDIFANTATHLVVFAQPSNAVAGVAIAPAVVVHALDASNNVATGFTGGITVSITPGTGDPTATLSGTLTVGAVAGVATFSNLSIDKTADGYSLDFAGGGVGTVTTGTFKITPAAATHLSFAAQQPTDANAGAALTPAVVVQALDAFNNVDTAYTTSIVVSITTNPGGGTLSGTTSKAAVHGVATFSDLSINKAGTGYVLNAASGTITDATSSSFNINAAALAQLVFTGQPVNTAAGAAITPAVVVEGQDAFGNKVTTFAGDVTVAIGTNPPTNGVLSGGTTQTASGGDATFANLSIDKAGQGYTLVASTAALNPTTFTSAQFNITPGTASVLVFTVQPGASTTAGTAISSPITVAAQDGLGNTVPSFAGDISVAIKTGTGTAGATLSGTTTITPTNGASVFSNLSVDSAGTGYQLTASATGLTDGTSNAFAITAGTATKLAFLVNPVTTTAGVSIPTIQVNAQDALGNTNPSYTANVTVAITGGTGKTGAALSGTKTVAASAGVASFSGLSIDSAGTGYTLTATSGSLTQAPSSGFDITAGAATQLVFSVPPSSAAAGATITPNVTVVAKDAIGNIDPNYTSTVSLTLPVNPGGATPNNASLAATAGVATFSSLFLDKVGTGYQLQASDGSLTSAPSNTFNITPGPASQLAFVVQPSTVTVGANIDPAVKVAAQDQFGNTVTTFSNNVVMSISTDPVGGTVLGGTLTKAAVSGIATFNTLDLNQAGNGFILQAAATGLTPGLSNAFNVIANTATQLFFNLQPPANTTAGNVMTSFTVEARDASGQPVPGYTGDVTISITAGTGAPGATFAAGTLTRTASAGTATFDDIEIDVAASNYKLTAVGTGGVTSTTSKFFAINPAAATSLVYAVQPSNATAAATITPQIEVKALDGFGNTATGFTDNVSMAISDANASGGTLSGTTTKAAVAGVATFSDLSIDVAQTGHTLTATDAGGAGAGSVVSSPFDITVSTSNHLVFGTQPTTATAGQTMPSFTVEARDASNTLLTGFTGNVTVSITGGTGTAGATLSGTKTVAAVAGVATFNNLSIDKSGADYQLSAVATGYAGATSNIFVVNAGAPAKVVFRQQPSNALAGAAISPAMTVELQDAFGNKVTGTAANVTLAIAVNAGGGTLSGTTTQAVNTTTAQATFPDISIDAAGTGYRLSASSGALSGDVSQAFTISAGTADHLVFTVSPSSAVAGVAITPSVKVTALDALGNTATSFNGNVSVAITPATGTPGAVLSGTVPVAAVAGVATFTDLSVDKVGTGYTLSATASGLTGSTSGTFDITPAAATALVFSVQPSNTAANANITPAVVVTAVDPFGNTATSYAGTITVAMGTNAGGAGSVLSGTKIKAATNGVATFSDLSINNVGNGYTLTAVGSSPALPLIGSNAFNIN